MSHLIFGVLPDQLFYLILYEENCKDCPAVEALDVSILFDYIQDQPHLPANSMRIVYYLIPL